jgi:hypothetical protein
MLQFGSMFVPKLPMHIAGLCDYMHWNGSAAGSSRRRVCQGEQCLCQYAGDCHIAVHSTASTTMMSGCALLCFAALRRVHLMPMPWGTSPLRPTTWLVRVKGSCLHGLCRWPVNT